MPKQLKLHPLAELFPEMTAAEFAAFKEDVRANGVRDAVWTWKGDVIDGRHRARACNELNLKCPAREWKGKEKDLVPFVLSLNLHRRHLSESQRAMVAARLANLRPGRPSKETGAIAPVSQEDASAMLNVSRDSVKRAAKVHASGSAELVGAVERGEVAVSSAAELATITPKEQAKVLAKGEKAILSAAKEIKDRRRQEKQQKHAPQPASPNDPCCTTDDLHRLVARGLKFGCIYADPPWQYGNQATRAATSRHYDTMPIEEIAALPVAELAAEQCHLHLWTTDSFLEDAIALLKGWGFERRQTFVWAKTDLGIGNYWRSSHEYMLLGIKGGLTFPPSNVKSWIETRRTEHSAKPEQIRELIEKMSPAPRLELFARKTSPGWTVFGNEIKRSLFDATVTALEAA